MVGGVAGRNAACPIARDRTMVRGLADRAVVPARVRVGAPIHHAGTAAAVVARVASEPASKWISTAGRACARRPRWTRATRIRPGATGGGAGVEGTGVAAAMVAIVAGDGTGAVHANGHPIA